MEGEKYFREMPFNNLHYFAINSVHTYQRDQSQASLGRGADSSRHFSRRR